MRAARIHAFGESLRVDDVDEPSPGADEVLVEMRLAGVNPLDVWVTQGTVAGGTQPLPFVPGGEGLGEVDGRLVLVRGHGLGVRRDGLYRERAAVPGDAPLPVPQGLDPEQVAGIGVSGPTAWTLVHDLLEVGPGDRVLVLGASGGVGSVVAQLARAAGATVWGQTTSPDKEEFVAGLGAHRVVVADAADLPAAVRELAPTVAVDPLAGPFTDAAIAALEPRGRLGLYGASAGARGNVDLRTLYRKEIQLRTYSGTIAPEDAVRAALRNTLDAVASGDLRVVVDEVLPLEDASEAHRRILERRVRGKLLLRP